MKKVILFGGSFDQIHNGHIMIAEAAKKQLKADEVVIILSRSPRWKQPYASVEDRLNMIKLAIKDLDGFTFSTFEIDNNSECDYSINTVRYFVNNSNLSNEDCKFYWLIGKDQVNQLDKWYEIDELAKLVQFVYYDRGDDNDTNNNVSKYNVLRIEGKCFDISSTMIREIKSLEINENVLDYIKINNLYYFAKINNYLDSSRYEHSFSVAKWSKRIAEKNNIDGNKAFIAGLFHDIAKCINKDESIKLMNEYFPNIKDMPTWSLHQFNSATIAKNEFGIIDENILNAISVHATGKGNMSPLAQIVYSADKIDPLRNYDSSSLIDACLHDYNKGFLDVLKENKEYLIKQGKNYNNNPFSAECFAFYLKDQWGE